MSNKIKVKKKNNSKPKDSVKEFYVSVNMFMHSQPVFSKVIIILNKLLTTVAYIGYPVLIVYLIWKSDPRWIRCVLTPGIPFVLLSIVRKLINKPRPYELYKITPIISKDSPGKSFPSRHIYSMFAIACAFLYINPYLGVMYMDFGIALSICRVLGGVHFIRDVVAGALTAVLCSVVGFIII